MKQRSVCLSLNNDEAIVLFECLARLEETERSLFLHASEATVLSKLHGQLESTLSEPFAPDYARILAAARQSVGQDG